MLIAPAVPTPVTTRIGSKVMEILSPSILLKMTAWWLIFLEMTSLVGCIFQPLWTYRFTPLWRTCSRRGLMWFCWGGKPFHILGTPPSINSLPQHEPRSGVIHSTMFSLLCCQTSSSHHHSQDPAVGHLSSAMCSPHFHNHFFTTTSVTVLKKKKKKNPQPLKGSYRIPKRKETKQNVSI